MRRTILLKPSEIRNLRTIKHEAVVERSDGVMIQWQFVLYRGNITWPASYIDVRGEVHSDPAVLIDSIGFRLERVLRVKTSNAEVLESRDYGIVTSEQRHFNALVGKLLRIDKHALNDTVLDRVINQEIDSWYQEKNRYGNPFGRTAQRKLKELVEESREHYREAAASIEPPKKKGLFDRLKDVLDGPNTPGGGVSM